MDKDTGVTPWSR